MQQTRQGKDVGLLLDIEGRNEEFGFCLGWQGHTDMIRIYPGSNVGNLATEWHEGGMAEGAC